MARAGRATRDLAASAAAGYLLGTLPSADLAARLAAAAKGARTDVRSLGSGNPGAVNVMAVLGVGWGYGVLAADALKAALACRIGGRLGGPSGAHLAGTAAVVGHCFPVWNRFRGGKGVAASMGQCFATFPAYFPIDLAVAWAVGHWRRRASTGTAAAAFTWVGAGLLWWRRGWPNGWGPRPSAALPLSAAASSAVLLWRFRSSGRVPIGAPPWRNRRSNT